MHEHYLVIIAVSATVNQPQRLSADGIACAAVKQCVRQHTQSLSVLRPAGDSVSRGGVTKLSKYMPLEAVVPEQGLSANDPPVFATAHCLIARIPDNQTLYYEANPANNKKVRERTGL